MLTFEEFVAYCKRLGGEAVPTAGGETTFEVLEKGRSVVFLPKGGKPQGPIRQKDLEAVLSKLAATKSYLPKDYQKETRQASYILGVMAKYRDEGASPMLPAGTPRFDRRLPVEVLRMVSEAHVLQAIDQLLDGDSWEPFIESTKYDLVTDDDQRFPPKAVFGKALALALGRETFPGDFSGGEDSPCFEVLRTHGYRIVLKDAAAPSNDAPEDEFPEGEVRLRTHARRERRPAAAKAKKADFLARHGFLGCERCKEDYSGKYGADAAPACIEVHHHKLAVSDMPSGYRTVLADLQCLCANCHRVVHHQLREAAKAERQSNVPAIPVPPASAV